MIFELDKYIQLHMPIIWLVRFGRFILLVKLGDKTLTIHEVALAALYVNPVHATGLFVPPAHVYPSGQLRQVMSLSQYCPDEQDVASSLLGWETLVSQFGSFLLHLIGLLAPSEHE
jgi:hypothetical protein